MVLQKEIYGIHEHPNQAGGFLRGVAMVKRRRERPGDYSFSQVMSL